jgi:hypothetical protein
LEAPRPLLPPCEVAVQAPAGEVLAQAAREAAEWGGELEIAGDGGRLRLPVLAGLRRGVISGQLSVRPAEEGSRLLFVLEQSEYTVHSPSVGILALAALGAVPAVLWPLVPGLLSVAPFGAVLAISGWLLVVARLRTSGPEDFLNRVAFGLSREPSDRQSGSTG